MRHQTAKMVALAATAFWASAAFSGNARTTGTATAVPYVAETRIAAPGQVGDFRLEFAETTSTPSAEFRYSLPDHPELRFTLSARAIGNMPEDESLRVATELYRGDTFMATFSASQQRDIHTTEPVALAIPLAGVDPASSLNGMRFDRHYTMQLDLLPDRVEMQSRGFVFVRGMHAFHLSASAAASRIDRPTFEALAARAARELVPALTISNIGRCGQRPDRNERHCFVALSDAEAREPASAEILTLRYDASDWSEQ